MTRDRIQTEVSALNASQRAALRSAVGVGSIEHITVARLGCITKVVVGMYGHNYSVKLGPKGKILDRKVFV